MTTLLEYGRKAKIEKDAYGYEPWLHQLLFMRDTLPRIWCATNEEHRSFFEGKGANLIGTHRSKSIQLPVGEIVHPSGRVTCVIRGNFHNWMVSIEATGKVTGKFGRLFDPSHETSSYYCEGFPESRVYGSYDKYMHKFTVCLYSEYDVATLFFLLDQWARGE